MRSKWNGKSSTSSLLVVALACAIAVGGCSGSSNEPNNVDVITWWNKAGEYGAMSRLIEIYEGKYPGQTVNHYAYGTSDVAREEIRERVIMGNPPATFQANGGWNLLEWVLANGFDAHDSKLEELDRYATWAGAVPAPVLDTVRFNGVIYAVPLNIHRLNVLFFNRQVFADNDVPEPTSETLKTLDDLFALCDTLKAKGVEPLALGTQVSWPLTHYLFENILVARAGGEYYRDFFRGMQMQDILDSSELQDSIADLSKLLSYDAQAPTRTWDGAVDVMRTGGAAMTIMGDWAKGYVDEKAAEEQTSVDLGAIPLPGTAGTFVFTTDTFGLPKGASNQPNALKLLELFGSKEGQDEFNLIKGSIPARDDAGLTKFSEDPISRDTILDFYDAALGVNDAELVPATSVIAPPDYIAQVHALLADFAGTSGDPARIDRKGNVSLVIHGLANRADALRNSIWHY
jgi:glucose/mannose transport system substrate-binding protein